MARPVVTNIIENVDITLFNTAIVISRRVLDCLLFATQEQRRQRLGGGFINPDQWEVEFKGLELLFLIILR